MIFRIHETQNEQSFYKKVQRQTLVHFLKILFAVKRNSIEFQGIRDENHRNEMEKLTKRMSSGNSERKFKDIVNIISSKETNDVYRDLWDCMDSFLDEKSMFDSRGNSQLGSLINKLNYFDPDKGRNKVASNSYSLFEKKIGSVYEALELYVKSYAKEIHQRRNLMESFDAPIGTDAEESFSLHEKIGVEDTYSFNDYVHLTRDFYTYFLENEDLRSARIKIAQLYNIYLIRDYEDYKNSLRTNKSVQNFLLGQNFTLSKEDFESIESLIDPNFITLDLINKASNRSVSVLSGRKIPIYEQVFHILQNQDADSVRLLGDFFTLLLKSRIQLTVKDCTYFRNFDLFKIANIRSLKDFKEIIESTAKIRNAYSEFPLLADYPISYVEQMERNQKIANSSRELENVRKSMVSNNYNNKEQDTTPTALPDILKSFLEELIRCKKESERHDPSQPRIRYEVARGLNEDTITVEDIKLAYKLLGVYESKSSIKDKLLEFSSFFSALSYDLKSSWISKEMSTERIEKYCFSLIKHVYYDDTLKKDVRNTDKLRNMWDIIQHANNEIIEHYGSTDMNKFLVSNEDLSVTKKFGVKYITFRDYEIPRIEIKDTGFFVRIYNCILDFTSTLFDKATLKVDGVIYHVNTEGVVTYHDQLHNKSLNLMEIEESLRETLIMDYGADSRTTANSIRSWAMSKEFKAVETYKDKIKADRLRDSSDIDRYNMIDDEVEEAIKQSNADEDIADLFL